MELGPGTDLSFYIHQGVGSGLSSYTADAKVQCMELGPGTDLGFYNIIFVIVSIIKYFPRQGLRFTQMRTIIFLGND